jgi:Flp pilus assembly protein TadB
VTLVPAALAAWAFARCVSRSPWFFVSLAWGLVGILLNNWTVTGMTWLAIVTGALTVLVLYLRLTRGAHGARSQA